MTPINRFKSECLKCGKILRGPLQYFDKHALCDDCFINNFRTLKNMSRIDLDAHIKNFFEGLPK